MTDAPTLGTVLSRGLRRRCPKCGEGQAFKGYLKVVDRCAHCDTPLSIYPCDDGPAYVTMLLVGHLVFAPVVMMNFFWTYPPEVLVPSLLAAIGSLTLIILPFVKGMFLNLLWHLKVFTGQR